MYGIEKVISKLSGFKLSFNVIDRHMDEHILLLTTCSSIFKFVIPPTRDTTKKL